jgi:hypothetical protein
VTQWQEVAAVFGVALPLWLTWLKLGQCFVELVRIRHELEDAAKRAKPVRFQ